MCVTSCRFATGVACLLFIVYTGWVHQENARCAIAHTIAIDKHKDAHVRTMRQYAQCPPDDGDCGHDSVHSGALLRDFSADAKAYAAPRASVWCRIVSSLPVPVMFARATPEDQTVEPVDDVTVHTHGASDTQDGPKNHGGMSLVLPVQLAALGATAGHTREYAALAKIVRYGNVLDAFQRQCDCGMWPVWHEPAALAEHRRPLVAISGLTPELVAGELGKSEAYKTTFLPRVVHWMKGQLDVNTSDVFTQYGWTRLCEPERVSAILRYVLVSRSYRAITTTRWFGEADTRREASYALIMYDIWYDVYPTGACRCQCDNQAMEDLEALVFSRALVEIGDASTGHRISGGGE